MGKQKTPQVFYVDGKHSRPGQVGLRHMVTNRQAGLPPRATRERAAGGAPTVEAHGFSPFKTCQ